MAPICQAAAMAEQIPPAYVPAVRNFCLESRIIEILAEDLLATTGCETGEPSSPRPQGALRIRELHEFMDREPSAGLRLETMVAHAGTSPDSLRRTIHGVSGMAAFKYLRIRNLLRARAALELHGVGVAGSRNPAGYATAHSRHFGIPPKRPRARA